ncbi:hypothetical protein IDM33_14290 [Acinetobacter seifertii]|nr:hypothetical protein [Acinetobacter seifertii]
MIDLLIELYFLKYKLEMIDILNVLENKFDIKFLKYEVDYLRWYYFVEKIKMDKVEMVIQKQFKKYEYFAFALFYF